MPWYPDAEPGSHHGAWAASRSTEAVGSRMSVDRHGWSQPATPDVWDIRCRTSIASLPLAANSGQ